MSSDGFNHSDILKKISGALLKYNDATIPDLIDAISRMTGDGSEMSKNKDMYWGLRNLNIAPSIPIHKEQQGIVLFTKPDLNLTLDNIAPIRTLSFLDTKEENNLQTVIRDYLDPHSHRTSRKSNSSLVDPNNPYITLLTNAISSLSAPPDVGTTFHRSQEGLMKEQWIMADSITEYNGSYDMTATFDNFKGGAIPLLWLAWLQAMGYQRTGRMYPHAHNVVQGRMDYFTRIERYKFDESGRFISQWWHCGAAAPNSIAIGTSMAYQRDVGYEMENKSVSMQFTCVGSIYNDPIQLFEFNERIERWNPMMRQDSINAKKMVKLPREEIPTGTYLAYPRINLATQEMEWYVPSTVYERIRKIQLSRVGMIPGERTENDDILASNIRPPEESNNE